MGIGGEVLKRLQEAGLVRGRQDGGSAEEDITISSKVGNQLAMVDKGKA